jgi:hypothetical protein
MASVTNSLCQSSPYTTGLLVAWGVFNQGVQKANICRFKTRLLWALELNSWAREEKENSDPKREQMSPVSLGRQDIYRRWKTLITNPGRWGSISLGRQPIL